MWVAPFDVGRSVRLLAERSWPRLKETLDSLKDEADLTVVMVAVAGGAKVSGDGNALASGLVGEVAANLLGEFFEVGKEDGLFVLPEALEMAF